MIMITANEQLLAHLYGLTHNETPGVARTALEVLIVICEFNDDGMYQSFIG